MMLSRIVISAGLLALLAAARPARADFPAAEAAAQRGDWPGALQGCKAEAASGEARCQNFLGFMNDRGLGVPQNAEEALRLYRAAAAQGLPAAQNSMGLVYENGRGVPKDDAEAARWYRLAADQNYGNAEANLGQLYLTGRGVPSDPAQAVTLFRRSAMRGTAAGQVRLAAALATGNGAPRDPIGAYIWFGIAARTSPNAELRVRAAADRDRMAAELSQPAIAAARGASERWAVGKEDPRLAAGTPPGGGSPNPGQRPPGGDRPGGGPRGDRPSAGGSGFIVSRDGYVLTNNHVVEGCREVRILRGGTAIKANVQTTDADLDVALLKIPGPLDVAARFRGDSIKAGENVVVVGYPLQGLLSSDASITTGIVSALAGLRNDKRILQITAPVQPGNSGGPLIDQNGAVVGIVVSKLNWRIANMTGAMPENINFAINADYARPLLERNGVKVETASGTPVALTTPAIAEKAVPFTVLVQCFK